MNLTFYLQYAARNLWRNRRWSTFAVFSVAAGVATVVALRSLGLAIGDALTSNIRSSNYGDITIQMGGDNTGPFSFENPENQRGFSENQIQWVQEWVNDHNANMTVYTIAGSMQISSLDYVGAGRPQFISSLFVDPQTFPPTADVFASDPAGVALHDLFQGGNEVVISQNLAEAQAIKVGDKVRVSGTTEEFIVRGIVPTAVRTGFRDLMAAFFGFAIFPNSTKDLLPVQETPTTISIMLADGATTQEIETAEEQLRSRINDYASFRTVPRMLKENQQIADVLGSFIVVMGLGALLIGGVGIINTMLVMVGRRTEEIAALKTFGLKAEQIAMLFMSEAFLLGVAGSVLGGVFGALLSVVANAYGQTLIQQSLSWRLYPEAIFFGLVLGLIITVVFGVLPVLTAVKVRPAIILRPNETQIPRAGVFQSLLSLVLVVVSVGLMAGQMLLPAFKVATGSPRAAVSIWSNPYFVGIIGVAITLLILGLLVGILWIIVWLLGKLPAFGIVDLRLALRNLSTRRVRTATTLLALSAGMFALSSISFVGEGVREILRFSLSGAMGGNVLIMPILPPAIANPLIDSKLDEIEGVEYRTRMLTYNGMIKAVDGVNIRDAEGVLSQSEARQAMREAANNQNWEQMRELSGIMRSYSYTLMARVTDNPNLNSGEIISGRELTPEDQGKRVAVVQLNPLLEQLGVKVGSVLTFTINNRDYDLEVVGLTPYIDPTNMSMQQGMMMGDVIVPPQALAQVSPDFQLNIAQIAPEHLNQALVEISSLPLVYSLDIAFLDGLLGRLINQFSAIPVLVGLLSLMAAAVIMANTVALSMLERRRQIGILKAVGLNGNRVLTVMLLENTLISLLGGLLGIGLSSLGVVIMSNFGLDVTVLIPRDAMPVAVALVIAAIVIAWLATFLSSQTILGERVTNVLRYE